jgi:hypothetical protein
MRVIKYSLFFCLIIMIHSSCKKKEKPILINVIEDGGYQLKFITDQNSASYYTYKVKSNQFFLQYIYINIGDTVCFDRVAGQISSVNDSLQISNLHMMWSSIDICKFRNDFSGGDFFIFHFSNLKPYVDNASRKGLMGDVCYKYPNPDSTYRLICGKAELLRCGD